MAYDLTWAGSREQIVTVGELLPWSLALVQPPVPGGANLPCPGVAGNRPHCAGACMWPQVLGECQPAWQGAVGSASPTTPPTASSSGAPVQGGSAAGSLPAAPCQLGPTQQARLAGCLWGGVQLPGICGMGLGRLQGQASWRCFGFAGGLDRSWRLDCLDLRGSLPGLLPHWTHYLPIAPGAP